MGWIEQVLSFTGPLIWTQNCKSFIDSHLPGFASTPSQLYCLLFHSFVTNNMTGAIKELGQKVMDPMQKKDACDHKYLTVSGWCTHPVVCKKF